MLPVLVRLPSVYKVFSVTNPDYSSSFNRGNGVVNACTA